MPAGLTRPCPATMVDSWPFAGLIRTILGVLPLFSATIRSPGFANVTAGTANAAATSAASTTPLNNARLKEGEPTTALRYRWCRGSGVIPGRVEQRGGSEAVAEARAGRA